MLQASPDHAETARSWPALCSEQQPGLGDDSVLQSLKHAVRHLMVFRCVGLTIGSDEVSDLATRMQGLHTYSAFQAAGSNRLGTSAVLVP
jgi:hypothetical protein